MTTKYLAFTLTEIQQSLLTNSNINYVTTLKASPRRHRFIGVLPHVEKDNKFSVYSEQRKELILDSRRCRNKINRSQTWRCTWKQSQSLSIATRSNNDIKPIFISSLGNSKSMYYVTSYVTKFENGRDQLAERKNIGIILGRLDWNSRLFDSDR